MAEMVLVFAFNEHLRMRMWDPAAFFLRQGFHENDSLPVSQFQTVRE
jgi:hypothetical protein